MTILIGCGSAVVKVKAIGNGGVEGVLDGTTMAGIAQVGKIGRGSGYGFARRGNAAYGEGVGFGGIYQKRVTGYNQYGRNPARPRRTYYVRMRNYRTPNPQTVPQQANRAKMAAAVAGWQALTAEEKQYYNERGKKANKVGRNLYIGWYIKNN